jgi:hypothetical protein
MLQQHAPLRRYKIVISEEATFTYNMAHVMPAQPAEPEARFSSVALSFLVVNSTLQKVAG